MEHTLALAKLAIAEVCISANIQLHVCMKPLRTFTWR